MPNGGTADVRIEIRKRSGKVVKAFDLPGQPVNTVLTKRFRCRLRAGTYRYFVFATDAAGNEQMQVGKKRLVVR